jgi:hypothetical protein
VRAIEAPDFFLFFYNKRVAHYLPKRVLTGPQTREVRALVEENFLGRALLRAGA